MDRKKLLKMTNRASRAIKPSVQSIPYQGWCCQDESREPCDAGHGLGGDRRSGYFDPCNC